MNMVEGNKIMVSDTQMYSIKSVFGELPDKVYNVGENVFADGEHLIYVEDGDSSHVFDQFDSVNEFLSEKNKFNLLLRSEGITVYGDFSPTDLATMEKLVPERTASNYNPFFIVLEEV